MTLTLTSCLQVVSAGKIKTVQLSDKVTTGRQQWLQWHADFAASLPALIKVRPEPFLQHATCL